MIDNYAGYQKAQWQTGGAEISIPYRKGGLDGGAGAGAQWLLLLHTRLHVAHDQSEH
jgi:hypothetical protein